MPYATWGANRIAAVNRVRAPQGCYLISSRIRLYYMMSLVCDGSNVTTFRLKSTFPAAAASYGFAPFWYGYDGNGAGEDMGQGKLNRPLSGCTISFYDVAYSNPHQVGVWFMQHGVGAELYDVIVKANYRAMPTYGQYNDFSAVQWAFSLHNEDGTFTQQATGGTQTDTIGTGNGTQTTFTYTLSKGSGFTSTFPYARGSAVITAAAR